MTTQPLTPEHHRLAAEWLHERLSQRGAEVQSRVQRMAGTQPEDAWCITLALLRLAPLDAPAATTGDTLRLQAASIPKDILEWHAEAFVDRVEREAHTNPVFRELLAFVSLPDDAAPADILQRLKAASGGRMEIYPSPDSQLGRVAYEVAELYRAGELSSVPRSTRFPVPDLAKEIERRLPGRTPDEYKTVAERALHWSR